MPPGREHTPVARHLLRDATMNHYLSDHQLQTATGGGKWVLASAVEAALAKLNGLAERPIGKWSTGEKAYAVWTPNIIERFRGIKRPPEAK
jgi:hypothetical protein